MLTPEQARTLQQQRGYMSDQRRRIQAIAWVPEALRPIAYGILCHDAQGQALASQDQAGRNALQEQSLAQLDALTPGQRLLLFAAFFPSMPEAIERGWMYLHGQPYERAVYYQHEFFRAPHRPEATVRARGMWLTGLLGTIAPQDDLPWLARHAAYLRADNQLGLLFAAVLDDDPAHGNEIFDILVRSAHGEDEIGIFGRHIPLALLAAARPDGWECVEQLLLGAQRAEGVRQTILEALPAAHPAAFRRILGTILDQHLVRFSAVTRAVNTWLGTTWDAAQAAAVTRLLRQLHTLMGDPAARLGVLESGSGEECYLALWATACEDVYAALPLAGRLLDDADVARRFAAARLLAGAYVPEAVPPLLRALEDADARVAAVASEGLHFGGRYHIIFNRFQGVDRGERLRRAAPDAFERVEAVLPRLPRMVGEPRPVLWNVPVPPLRRERVADLLAEYLDARDPRRLIPYLGQMSGWVRWQAAKCLAEYDVTDSQVRAALFALLKDRTSMVRDEVLKILKRAPILESELSALEALLGRKSEDLRRGVLELMLTQPDAPALASVDRLLAASGAEARLAGLELLRLLHAAGRERAACAARAAAYRERRASVTAPEQALLAPLLEGEHEVPTLANALGLVRPEALTPLAAPRPRDHAWTSPAAIAGLRSLDELIHEHRTDAYTATTLRVGQEVLLGTEVWAFPAPNAALALADDLARLPFADLWRGWAAARGETLRDADGLELVRMLVQLERRGADETRAILAQMGVVDEPEAADAARTPDADDGPDTAGAPRGPRLSLRYHDILVKLCWWLMRLDPPAGGSDLLLDHLESVLTQIPERELRDPEDGTQRPRYRWYQKLQHAVTLTRSFSARCSACWTDAHAARFWNLLRWSDTLPQPHLRYRPQVAETLAAHRAGAASEADLVFQFVGPHPDRDYGPTRFGELYTFSARKPDPLLAAYPIAGTVHDRCARRVLEVELRRGEMPTAATDAALSLRSLAGCDTFVAVVLALGEDQLARGYSYSDRGRSVTLSHLLRITFPGPADTPEALAAQPGIADIPRQRLIEAAVYAPQWAAHVERVLGWDGFAEGVWWAHAHTKDSNWSVDQTIRKEWAARISEWTPLASTDLSDGAVDVAWFRRVIAVLGEERWERLYQAAKYSSSGTGHTRARLFADAMLGRVDAEGLVRRMAEKRHRDAACALGLLALPAAPTARQEAILARYQALQEFIRSAQAFGAQRREGDQKAARIGLENLARTAGYADPSRFQWAMELREVADLAGGPLTVARGPVTLTLRVDALGQPRLHVEKAGRPLKDIPPQMKKDPAVVALRERKQRLEQQSARMRAALEQAMCREEVFRAGELAGLLRHPLLAPMLEQLVLIGPSGMGYLASGDTDAGPALRTLDGDLPLDRETPLRIAHPHDLYASGDWSRYQHECFAAERIQPFKQVFRELYPLTEAERRDDGRSRRYAGHQLQPQQALALLAGRDWVTSAYDGSATRTFHGRGITVSVDFLGGYGTPAEVEGLTIEGVGFRAAGEAWGKPLPLDAVSPILFSEAMRDLDLVVSVAHQGGVDPEGSASTVEMRAALLREVCDALALTNVRIQSSHVVITGTLGEYSVHLGSGVVHRLPGGALCIVPVHAQHRGRFFLPFADDDPKTAEVLSKVLLLARDTEIKDPVILNQIYARV